MEKDNIKQNAFSSSDPNYWKNLVNNSNSSKVTTTTEKSLIPDNRKHNLCNTLVLSRKNGGILVGDANFYQTFPKRWQ